MATPRELFIKAQNDNTLKRTIKVPVSESVGYSAPIFGALKRIDASSLASAALRVSGEVRVNECALSMTKTGKVQFRQAFVESDIDGAQLPEFAKMTPAQLSGFFSALAGNNRDTSSAKRARKGKRVKTGVPVVAPDNAPVSEAVGAGV